MTNRRRVTILAVVGVVVTLLSAYAGLAHSIEATDYQEPAAMAGQAPC
jgi:hypothetical protein